VAVGDLVDRGPDGLGAIRLVAVLERDERRGRPLPLGNHEPSCSPPTAIGDADTSFPGTTVSRVWRE
jgi:hypothetical protein